MRDGDTTVVISIQARMGSTRLPGKALLELGNRRVIEYVVDRAQDVFLADEVALTTGDRTANEAIREWCQRRDLRCETGPEDDLLERHRRVASSTDADVLVRLTGDCPFLPPTEVERVVAAHGENDARYTTNVASTMPVGTAVDAIDVDVLDELSDHGDTHPVERLREEPAAWKTTRTIADGWAGYGDVHLAVDTPDDYWTLTDAVEAVGDDPKAVASFLRTEG